MDLHPNTTQNTVSLYKDLYNNLPGFAWRAAIMGEAPWGGYRLKLEVVSAGCIAIFGLPPDKMLGTNTIEQCAHPEDLEYVKQKTREAVQSHHSVIFYYRIITADRQTVKWVREETKCIYSGQGDPIYLEGFLIDVTQEKFQKLMLQEDQKCAESLTKETDGRLGDMIGKSPAMRLLYSRIRLAAASDAPIILYGETGSGKDLAARTLHLLRGNKGPFVPVNCGAIPETLMESEFFGHVKGAFSGAVANHSGFVAAANGGTLFLDEVGEIPLPLQIKLLRVLESKTFSPVGSSKIQSSQFRLVCATNRDLALLVKQGKMRSDFYYRVHVISMTIPPLRERMEDIPQLIHTYLTKNGVSRIISPLVNERIKRYPWPGNIRELYNFLDRYIVFGDEEANSLVLHAERGKKISLQQDGCTTLQEAVAAAEKDVIAKALASCSGHLEKSAGMLGISLSTLKRKLQQYGLGRRHG